MKTSAIVDLLDSEFRVREVGDPHLAKYALTDATRGLATEAFLNEQSGLMFDFTSEVKKVYSVCFVTCEVLDTVLEAAKGEPSLVFTHHPHDYHEDERGFGPFPVEYIKKLKKQKIAVYTIHTPLDVGRKICVSKSLAERIGLANMEPFYEAGGGHLGVTGTLPMVNLDEMAGHLCRSLGIESADVFDNGEDGGLIAAVAGGGDQSEILKKAHELGCRTYITGTAVHRWQLDWVQEGNREFHRLAREWGINIIGASHYNTEKCACQDIALYLQQNGVPAEFLDDPILENYVIGNWQINRAAK